MQVIAEEPWNWFLFNDGGTLYLDVLVEHGAISFNVTAELDVEQIHNYSCEGIASLTRLAAEMRNEALMRRWRAPALPFAWAQRSISAVHEWQKKRDEK